MIAVVMMVSYVISLGGYGEKHFKNFIIQLFSMVFTASYTYMNTRGVIQQNTRYTIGIAGGWNHNKFYFIKIFIFLLLSISLGGLTGRHWFLFSPAYEMLGKRYTAVDDQRVNTTKAHRIF